MRRNWTLLSLISYAIVLYKFFVINAHWLSKYLAINSAVRVLYANPNVFISLYLLLRFVINIAILHYLRIGRRHYYSINIVIFEKISRINEIVRAWSDKYSRCSIFLISNFYLQLPSNIMCKMLTLRLTIATSSKFSQTFVSI